MRNQYGAQIEQAIWQAPHISYATGVPTIPNAEGMRLTFDPAEVDDAFPITVNDDRDVIPPSTIVVSGPEDLDTLYDEFDYYLSVNGIGSIPKPVRDEEVSHEVQHAKGAQLLGATVTRFQLSIVGFSPETRALAFQVGYRAQNFRTTRLGLAVATAYPEYRSQGDLNLIASLGYAGVEDVAKRAYANSLPIPLA
jgi:hypothetical protein